MMVGSSSVTKETFTWQISDVVSARAAVLAVRQIPNTAARKIIICDPPIENKYSSENQTYWKNRTSKLPAPPSGWRLALAATVRYAILIIHIAVSAAAARVLIFGAASQTVSQTVLRGRQVGKRGCKRNACKYPAERR
jgi:hypothetical protein